MFTKIENDYPVAWGKFAGWFNFSFGRNLEISESGNAIGYHFTDGVHSVMMWREFCLRHFYDFFDEQGIFIQVFRGVGGETDAMGFYTTIDKGWIAWSKTRTEAETEAFLKAFEILEIKQEG